MNLPNLSKAAYLLFAQRLWKSTALLLLPIIGIFLMSRVDPVFSQFPGEPASVEVSQSGQMSLLWGDGPPGTGRSALIFSLSDEAGKPTQIVINDALQQQSGGILALDRRRLSVKGQLKRLSLQGKITEVLEASQIQPVNNPGGSPVLGEVAAAITGSQPWINILCKYQDIATEPKSPSYFQGLFSSTKPGLNHYWKESSYDLVNIDGTTAVGWYILPNTRAYYTSLGTSQMLTTIFNDCVAAADPDVFFPNYLGVNIMLNGELDGSAWGGSRWTTLDGASRFWYSTWEPPWGYGNQTVLAHEMGHGFGLPHSSGDYGYTYDNRWDVMSDTWSNCSRSTDPTYGCLGQHTISFHKDRLQWIPAAQKLTVSSGTQTATLEQLTLPQTTNVKMIILPVAGSSTVFFTVEVRRWAGYDIKLPGEAVIIHKVDTTRMNPAHVVDPDGNGNTGDAGAMWTVGETFSDPIGISVTVNTQTPSGYTVTVTNNTGTTPTPTPTPTAVPTPAPIPGDANGDGKVDTSDYTIWFAHYNLTTANGPADGDFNRDSMVDGMDYVIWLTHYGT
ncbi:MAG: hypothetical protein A2900_05535 [Candidatus Chisholmbacteria bacterium RIFCSPLOWO2_01_FULL_50_28]|uniref:Dockerin domain-containing protein n=1 Tax=Candidatus Chisholmbacteria bacterium RIFCSPHIGHO2_01_FULL_52_32 TaxID=1797591 RepID=A0A1G1VRU3_9BACT|nr:MAG: hypothetical protein A2786_01210 [Candidatus Chisholmbacteria bacterium RIFCSPHIGHO2_01_FULL_52_32]OGY20506.1 MAG: hypothetical protein A2900_05535 [Candidatus Chisholmbacteria bacterium RIFCSPLOWO2_01_FULL_50_28]